MVPRVAFVFMTPGHVGTNTAVKNYTQLNDLRFGEDCDLRWPFGDDLEQGFPHPSVETDQRMNGQMVVADALVQLLQ